MADMDIATATEPDLALLRLLQLVSPSLPVGGFTYSQGIEWAVECGWIESVTDLESWLTDQLQSTIARLDLPILMRLYAAVQRDDLPTLQQWSSFLLACRETAELRFQETPRIGRAAQRIVSAQPLPQAHRRGDGAPDVRVDLGIEQRW